MENPIQVKHLIPVASQLLAEKLRSAGLASNALEITELSITDAFFREDGNINVELTMTVTNGSQIGQWFYCKPKLFSRLAGVLSN